MTNKIKYNQNRRRLRREKEKKKKRILYMGTGVFFVLLFTFAMTSFLGKNEKVVADTAEILKKNTEDVKVLEGKVKDVSSTDQLNKLKFSDKLLAYKRLVSDAEIYSENNIDSKVLLEIKAPEYVKFYGTFEGWSKISYKNITGYVLEKNLKDTYENQLVVVDGTLVVTKAWTIPSDFKISFDEEAESVLMVMIESLRRDGLNVRVGLKYLDSDNEVLNSGDSLTPNYRNSDLRTGLAVEFLNGNPESKADFEQTKESKWLEENAHKYGFIKRYPSGKEEVTGFSANPRIYRFVGTDLAQKLYDGNLTMEEYFK